MCKHETYDVAFKVRFQLEKGICTHLNKNVVVTC